jgi:hypothetical protein
LDANDTDNNGVTDTEVDGDPLTSWLNRVNGDAMTLTVAPNHETDDWIGKRVIKFNGTTHSITTPAMATPTASDAFVVFSRAADTQEVASINSLGLLEGAYTNFRVNGAAASAIKPTVLTASIVHTNTAATTSSQAWTFGGANLTGAIAEILVYNRALSDGERRVTECYLSEKWGVTITQP